MSSWAVLVLTPCRGARMPTPFGADPGTTSCRAVRATMTWPGGPGDDLLFGDEGDDRLVGGPGTDLFNGGPGQDELVDPDLSLADLIDAGDRDGIRLWANDLTMIEIDEAVAGLDVE